MTKEQSFPFFSPHFFSVFFFFSHFPVFSFLAQIRNYFQMDFLYLEKKFPDEIAISGDPLLYLANFQNFQIGALFGN